VTISEGTRERAASMPATREGSGGRRLDIQGLRAIAVLGVLLYHGHFPGVHGGFAGVDVFFVISGFLISSQLLRSLARTGRISLADFYSRRARRILPASFAVLIATTVAGWIFLAPLQGYAVLRDAIATALYVPNYLFAVQGTDYLHETAPPSLFQHYWSLGVEEQFYLIWPLLLLVTFMLGRRSRRALAAVMVAVIAVSAAACVWLSYTDQPWAFFSLPTRAWEFAVGGLIALVAASGRLTIPKIASAALAWAGIAGLAAVMLVLSDSVVFPGWAVLAPVAATGAVILGDQYGGAAAPTRLLSLAPLTFLGEISYSLYLVHWPVLTIPFAAEPVSGVMITHWEQYALMAICVPLAWLSYRFIETPFRSGRRTAAWGARPTLLTAAAVTGVIALSLTGFSARAASAPLAGGGSVASVRPAPAPPGTSYVPANLEPHLRGAAGTLLLPKGCEIENEPTSPHACRFGTSPDAPLVVLFGDSHASEWYPALRQLADEGRIRLESQTKSGCPAPAVAVTWLGMPYPECDQWRANVIARIDAERPALVLLGAYSADHAATDAAAWRAGLRETVRALAGHQLALLVDTPGPNVDVPTCLSGHLQDTAFCSVALDGSFRALELSMAKEAGIAAIDVDPYLCANDVCPAVIGNTLVYRDGSHLTAAMSAELGPIVAPEVEQLLAEADR